MKKIILTGDRPTGKLHLGHYFGSLKRRVQLQNSNNFDEIYIEISDAQALTDNHKNINKIKDNIIEVALDYLSCGIDPEKTTIFIQSQIPELTELTFYYLNLVTLSRLERNPTIKEEIKLRNFNNSIPVGFLTYPISQAADITGFDATTIPVGDDQLPMIEQTREIVRTFNNLYTETLVEPEASLPENKNCFRLPGIDGKAKMSKSLNNAIYLSDTDEEIKEKVLKMYTDPNHIKITDPGKIEGNVVFTYLDVFVKEDSFKKYLPEYENLDQLKEHYQKGGLGDIKIKLFLYELIKEELTPIRQKREQLQKNIEKVITILEEGNKKARKKVQEVTNRVKKSIGINYFENDMFKNYLLNKEK